MAAINKISKQTSDPTELSVAQALYDLETSVADLKADLRPLQISAAREVEVGAGKKAIVIFVPVPMLKAFHKIQQRLTRELEKKFSDRHVVFIAQRRILKKPGRRSRTTQKRPRNRTLTSVHEKILEDLVYPTEIVGKRTRNLVDGRKIQKVYVIAIHRPLSLHPSLIGWQGNKQSCRYVQDPADVSIGCSTRKIPATSTTSSNPSPLSTTNSLEKLSSSSSQSRSKCDLACPLVVTSQHCHLESVSHLFIQNSLHSPLSPFFSCLCHSF